MVAKIIEHMQKTGEWGEFFPLEFSPFAYNETIAYDYFPLTKEEVEKRGWSWHNDETEKMYKGPLYDIPDDVKDAKEDILKAILSCSETGKYYKIIPQELEFLKQVGLPVPRISPNQRRKNRMAMRNPLTLHNRKCDKCGADIFSSYDEGRVEPVYCEKCYLEAVY